MDSKHPLLFDFWVQVERDLADQGLQPLSRYLLRYPNAESEVAAAYLELVDLRDKPSAPAVGEVLGSSMRICEYEVRGILGQGGQGTVYAAFDERLGRELAIKVLNPLRAWSESDRARLQREAQILARLAHPGICPILELGTEQGLPCIVMPRLSGQSLKAWFDARAADASEAPDWLRLGGDAKRGPWLPVAIELCRAVKAAHEAHIVHRDLKPGNIIIDHHGKPVVLDFGLGRDLESGTVQITLSGEQMGTPAYMAPEQFQASGKPRESADVWALGVILIEWITGKRPFQGATISKLERAIAAGLSPSKLNSLGIRDRELQAILETALAVRAEDRYPNASALLEDLERLRDRRPVLARRLNAMQRLMNSVQRNPLTTTLIFLGLGLSATLGFIAAEWSLIERGSLAIAEESREQVLKEIALRRILGEHSTAQETLQQALEKDPQDVPLRAALWTELALGRDRKGLESEFKGPHAQGSPQLRRLAEFLREEIPQQGMPKEFRARAVTPEEHEVLSRAALEAADRLKSPVAGRIAFEEAQLALAKGPDGRLDRIGQVIVTALAAERPDLAAAYSRLLLERWPDQPEAALFAAFGLLRSDLPESRRAFALAYPLHDRLGVQAFEVDLLLSEGQVAAAQARYDSLDRQIGPKHPLRLAHLERGLKLALRGGDRQRMATIAAEGLRLAPDHQDFHLSLGLAARGAGLFERAIHHFQRAGFPARPGALTKLELADALLQVGRSVDAKTLLTRVSSELEAGKKAGESLTAEDDLLALLLLRSELSGASPENAEKLLQSAQSRWNSKPALLAELALLRAEGCLQSGTYKRGLQSLELAKATSRTKARALWCEARLHRAANDLLRCEEALRAALDHPPYSAEILLDYADLIRGQEDRDRVRQLALDHREVWPWKMQDGLRWCELQSRWLLLRESFVTALDLVSAGSLDALSEALSLGVELGREEQLRSWLQRPEDFWKITDQDHRPKPTRVATLWMQIARFCTQARFPEEARLALSRARAAGGSEMEVDAIESLLAGIPADARAASIGPAGSGLEEVLADSLRWSRLITEAAEGDVGSTASLRAAVKALLDGTKGPPLTEPKPSAAVRLRRLSALRDHARSDLLFESAGPLADLGAAIAEAAAGLQ